LKRAIELIIPADSAVSRLYMGLADCYKMAEKYPEQIETMKERYARYDPTNHRLLYYIASVYYWQLKDNEHAEQYVREFLKTRPKNLRPQQLPEDMDRWSFGSDDEYYKAAEHWLEQMELKRKVENFFQGKN
jgi:tetratricopeptide (TPR) repeat protein